MAAWFQLSPQVWSHLKSVCSEALAFLWGEKTDIVTYNKHILGLHSISGTEHLRDGSIKVSHVMLMRLLWDHT